MENLLYFNDFLTRVCYYQGKENEIIIDCDNLKLLFETSDFYENDKEIYHLIIKLLCDLINKVLVTYPKIVAHLYVKKINVFDLEKHFDFIKKLSVIMKMNYNEKLETCYIYESSVLFTGIYNFIVMFDLLDKNTIKKIKFIDDDKHSKIF